MSIEENCGEGRQKDSQYYEKRDSAISNKISDDKESELEETISKNDFVSKDMWEYVMGDKKDLTIRSLFEDNELNDYSLEENIIPDYFKRVLELIEDEETPRYDFILDEDEIVFSTPDVEENEEVLEEELVPTDWSEFIN